jgi:hypothetical protein
MANDLENRIENLERMADKVKKARFGSKDWNCSMQCQDIFTPRFVTTEQQQ